MAGCQNIAPSNGVLAVAIREQYETPNFTSAIDLGLPRGYKQHYGGFPSTHIGLTLLAWVSQNNTQIIG